MKDNILIKNLKERFDLCFRVLEDTISRCPDELWNKKCSGYIFSHQLVHIFQLVYFWMMDKKIDVNEEMKIGINGLSIYNELDSEQVNITKKEYTKAEVLLICDEAKKKYEKWFEGKNDDWLFLPLKMEENFTNFDETVGQLQHFMYHIGHFDAIFRERNIQTRKYLWEE